MTETFSSGGTDLFEYDLYQAWKSGNVFERFFHCRRIDEVQSLLTELRDPAILDYGCNTGTFVIALTSRGYRIAGFDISKANIERAQAYGQAAQKNIEWFLDTLPERRWDCILLTNVLEYVIDKQSVMKNVLRHLNPDGSVIVSLANPGHPYIRFAAIRQLFSNRDKHDIAQSEPSDKLKAKELLRLFKDHGFFCTRRKHGLGWVNTHFVFQRTVFSI